MSLLFLLLNLRNIYLQVKIHHLKTIESEAETRRTISMENWHSTTRLAVSTTSSPDYLYGHY